MKAIEKITGILMMLILTGTLSINAQRETRAPVSGFEKPQRPMMLEPSDSLKKRGMRKGMAENMDSLNLCKIEHPAPQRQAP